MKNQNSELDYIDVTFAECISYTQISNDQPLVSTCTNLYKNLSLHLGQHYNNKYFVQTLRLKQWKELAFLHYQLLQYKIMVGSHFTAQVEMSKPNQNKYFVAYVLLYPQIYSMQKKIGLCRNLLESIPML